MVNAGAIATTSLVQGRTPNEQWDNIQAGFSEFAGRPLQLDEIVYSSARAQHHQLNHRTPRRAARLARSPGDCSQINGRPANTLGTTASSVDMLDSPTTPA
jgi:glutaminase